MKKLILAVLLASCFASSVLAKTTEPTNSVPQGADLDKFPVFNKGELTVSYAEPILGLRYETVKKPMVVFNHFRQDGSWRLQTLPVGDGIWVEKTTGIARYRAACSNRIVPVLPCPICSGMGGKSTESNSAGARGNGGNNSTSLAAVDRFSNAFAKGFGDSSEFVGGVLGLLLPVLIAGSILGLAGFGLWSLFRRQQTPPAPVPTPPVVPQGQQTGFAGPPPATAEAK